MHCHTGRALHQYSMLNVHHYIFLVYGILKIRLQIFTYRVPGNKSKKLMKLHVRTVLTLYFSDPRVGANASALKLWYRINIGGNVECKTKNPRSLVKAQCSRDMICNWQSRFISAAKMYTVIKTLQSLRLLYLDGLQATVTRRLELSRST